jgi:hypothetical protein
LRITLIVSAVSLILVGCSSSSAGDDSSVAPGSGVAQNPGGKPQNEQEAQMATAQQQQGNAVNAQRDKDAAAMQAAMAKSGGK